MQPAISVEVEVSDLTEDERIALSEVIPDLRAEITGLLPSELRRRTIEGKMRLIERGYLEIVGRTSEGDLKLRGVPGVRFIVRTRPVNLHLKH